MNPLRVNFEELYDRHLRRHSEFWLNVFHFAGVVGIDFCLCSLAHRLSGSVAAVVAAAGISLLVLAVNLPFRLMPPLVATVALVLAAAIALPLPWWVALAVIVLLHRSQVWSHLIWKRDLGMDGFAAKYRKGPALSFLLALYELPILLNYLLFDRGRRVADEGFEASAQSNNPAAADARTAVRTPSMELPA